MPCMILRLIGHQDDVDTLMTALRDLKDIEHLVQLADLPQLNDESDPSAAESAPHLLSIQLDVPDDAAVAERVQAIASDEARKLSVNMECFERES